MNYFHQFIKEINSFLWSAPLMLLILGTHLYYTFRLHFIQKKVGKGIRLSVQSDEEGDGEVSPFATLATT